MGTSCFPCPIGQCVTLWKVRGVEESFATKLDAEAAARYVFPTEDVDTRYGRIYFLLSEPRRS